MFYMKIYQVNNAIRNMSQNLVTTLTPRPVVELTHLPNFIYNWELSGLSAASPIMGNSSNSPWGGDKTLTRAAAADEEVMTAVWSRAICNNGAGRGRNCDLFGGRDQISEATRA